MEHSYSYFSVFQWEKTKSTSQYTEYSVVGQAKIDIQLCILAIEKSNDWLNLSPQIINYGQKEIEKLKGSLIYEMRWKTKAN